MARATWQGTIQFGLVNIPVRLFRAAIPQDVRFHLLHGADGGRIHHKRICSIDGREVELDEIVKGFESDEGEHVIVEPSELEAIESSAPHTAVIEDFVDADAIDPIYVEKTYYVVPEPESAKAYQLLLRAIEDSGRVAIARIMMRMRQHLCAMRPARGLITLSTLYYANEVVSPSDLDVPSMDEEVTDAELALAERLVDAMATRFRPHHYRDEYRQEVLSLLRQKAAGRDLVRQGAATLGATTDLRSALAASLTRAQELPALARERRASAYSHSDADVSAGAGPSHH